MDFIGGLPNAWVNTLFLWSWTDLPSMLTLWVLITHLLLLKWPNIFLIKFSSCMDVLLALYLIGIVFSWYFLERLYEVVGYVTLAYSSAYHPQSDGQIEVLNCCM